MEKIPTLLVGASRTTKGTAAGPRRPCPPFLRDPNWGAQGNALDLWAGHTGSPLYEAAISLAEAFQFNVKHTEKRGNP